jgi:hypothetical protein
VRTAWAIIRKLNDGTMWAWWWVALASQLCYILTSFKEIDMKYVRYIKGDNAFMRKGDIGIVEKEHESGDLEVRWLNPIQPHIESVPTWFVMRENVEVIG